MEILDISRRETVRKVYSFEEAREGDFFFTCPLAPYSISVP